MILILTIQDTNKHKFYLFPVLSNGRAIVGNPKTTNKRKRQSNDCLFLLLVVNVSTSVV